MPHECSFFRDHRPSRTSKTQHPMDTLTRRTNPDLEERGLSLASRPLGR